MSRTRDEYAVYPDDDDAQCECGHTRDDHTAYHEVSGACSVRKGTGWHCDCTVYMHDSTRDEDVINERVAAAREWE